jgi:hypothetical protein
LPTLRHAADLQLRDLGTWYNVGSMVPATILLNKSSAAPRKISFTPAPVFAETSK